MGRGWQLTIEQKQEAVERYEAGETPKQIADDFGVSGPAISALVARAGVRRRHRPHIAPGRKRYDDAQRREIARQYGEGVPAAELAAEYATTEQTVYSYAKEFRILPPERPSSRSGQLMRTYGIDEVQYDELLDQQGGGCAICGSRPNGKRLAVDHCHDTGRVRGLLCSNCNLGLGNFQDSKGLLRKAYHYLRQS